jgi:hypothetical protein
VCIFEDVFVPWDRVFLAGEHEQTEFLVTTYANHHRHSCIGARAGFGDLLIGAGALMLEANPELVPSPEDNPVIKVLHQTSDPRGEPTYPDISSSYNVNYGWGILDAYRSVIGARSYSSTNSRPQITSFEAQPDETTTGSVVRLIVEASDNDEDPLTYELEVDDGTYTGEGPEWEWTAPDLPGEYSFLVTVSDPDGANDQQRTSVTVIEGSANRPPVINSFFVENDKILVGGRTTVITVASVPDDDPIDYEYDAIRGTIQGIGESVTYIAPNGPGSDTISVRVFDDRGASTIDELIVTIFEEQTNSPPTIILLNLDPPILNSTGLGSDVILTAIVEDPDGLADISLVVADLTNIGGNDGEKLHDDGTNGDNISNDGVFTLLLPLPPSPVDGIYKITVTAFDSEDAVDNSSIDLIIEIEPSGEVSSGSSSSRDMTLVIIGLVVVFLIVIAFGAFIMMRGRKKRKKNVPFPHHPQMGQVRYRPSGPAAPPIQAMPSDQEQPKFNVIQSP